MVVSKSLKSLFQTRHSIINMRKCTPLQRLMIAKYIPWIILLSITLTANSKGHSDSLRNSSDLGILKQTSIGKSPQSRATNFINDAIQAKGTKVSMSRSLLSMLLLFSHVISIGLSLLILSYLNSQPIARQCLLLYLYKDFVCISSTLQCLWALVSLIDHLSFNGYRIDGNQAKLISFVIYFMRTQFFIYLNLISLLKIYMIKKGILDPPMPFGDDEDLGKKIIRFSSAVPFFVFTTTMYMCGMYPFIYNSLLPNSSSVNTSTGELVFMAPVVFLIITFLFIFMATIYCERNHQTNLDTGIPSQLGYGYVWLILVSFVMGVLRLIFGMQNSLNLVTQYLTGINSLTVISIQMLLIWRNNQLKSYVKSYLSFDIFQLNIRFVCMCLLINVFVGLSIN